MKTSLKRTDMRDFSLDTYGFLLEALIGAGYKCCSFARWKRSEIAGKVAVIRHDVDKLPEASLAIARLESQMGIRSSFYFRMHPLSFDADIIKKIASLNHEIGYHYEDLSFCGGNHAAAVIRFKKNLFQLRELVPVDSVCMHGSPLSKIDNRELMKFIDIEALGLLGEPYHDLDVSEFDYFSDTGRTWDEHIGNVRDRMEGTHSYHYKSTFELINGIVKGETRCKLMITTHPQRWRDEYWPWLNEKISQGLKNQVKRVFIRRL